VFQYQDGPGGAFDPENLRRQIDRAKINTKPPWRQGKQRRRTGKRKKKPDPERVMAPIELSGDDIKDLWEHYGLPSNRPLDYKINLCDDGSVITRDGEFIGTWSMDENEHPSFTPDGADEPLLYDNWVGLLCQKIMEWHEAQTGMAIANRST
jgi:hypothetical protein